MKTTFYAHTLDGRPPTEWELLQDHLHLVANGDGKQFTGAAGFAAAFGAEDWGQLAGLWHDLGKYSAKFQKYLHDSQPDVHRGETVGRVNHSSAGAIYAHSHVPQGGMALAYCIAGHHAGLSDLVDPAGGRSGLKARLQETIESVEQAPTSITEQKCPQPPPLQWMSNDYDCGFQFAFFTRMLFSCLVDADFLATETFMSPDRAELRPAPAPTMAKLSDVLDSHLSSFDPTSSTVNRKRAEVLAQCRTAAQQSPGFFSLQVPTGGGKTLSSLAFAVQHAALHDLRRVIYAIPFTSIIEQTAEVFRDALHDCSAHILEHHSNLDLDGQDQEATTMSRLAAENWDAPLVVTTNVQLFESLFAFRTSRCRKLHRIARSVIVLDEAQTLPVFLLKPTLMALQELVTNYGCTVVLCTATQPAIERNDSFPIGLTNVRPIVEQSQQLFDDLKRVDISVIGKLADYSLVERLASHDRVLCIVNTKRHAARLYEALRQRFSNDGHIFHLSAFMCPKHRSEKLAQIKDILANTERPCHIVSTQLVEAGVDIDLPVVYRAMAGLDSIAQAAGRCNREGKLPRGQVFVFNTETKPPAFVDQAAQSASRVIPDYQDDLLSPAAVYRYFQEHYWTQGGEQGENWDKAKLWSCFRASGSHFQFREAATKYKLIDNAQTPIIVPHDSTAQQLCDDLLSMEEPPSRGFDRKLQCYLVNVMPHDLEKLRENCVLVEAHGRWILQNKEAYTDEQGLTFDAYGLDADTLVL